MENTMTDNTTHVFDNSTSKHFMSDTYAIPRIKFWASPEAKTPNVSTAGSGGLDLYVYDFTVEDNSITIQTGIYTELPRGHVGLLLPRSSTGIKGLRLKNTVGVIDSDYRGEIKIVCDRFDAEEDLISIGNKIAQLIIIPVCPFPVEQVGNYEDLSVTSRDTGGFGSTGNS
jgi:dUTP pyrophosphatase